ncbi:uncharacterized protein LOC34620140 [Cyclospora cayetanensis]|uniref:Uncharacterized protein LOC34620140 n=2 Tax=Cyclospora cayetanensis TaxID=88456 RepID=A0A6P5WDI3_9EIME|nr:uncharacterized protein LOC34620140 [Cyclospora cayetanensis]OEH77785.1 hypothetical protein cyc_03452 [Cyclospora cayetanensis]
MSITEEIQEPVFAPAPDVQPFATASPRTLPPRPKPPKTVRGLPMHQRKLYRNLARQTPRVQGLTFDHNQIRWISYWKNEQNKQVQKHFPVSRYGFFGARAMALEERNRIQGWPLDADEAFDAIERLKVDATREEGAIANREDSQQQDTDDEHPTAQELDEVTQAHTAGEDGEDGHERRRPVVGSIIRRRRARQRVIRRKTNAGTQTDRRTTTYAGGQGPPDMTSEPYTPAELREASAIPPPATYAEFLARAYTASASVHSVTSMQSPVMRRHAQAAELFARQHKNGELADVLLALSPVLSAGMVYLEGQAVEAQNSGASRLVSMASSSFEEPEPLVEPNALPDQEPDALRDLLNCVVSRPTDTGVDWDAEASNTASIVDVSRPTRNPNQQQQRPFSSTRMKT